MHSPLRVLTAEFHSDWGWTATVVWIREGKHVDVRIARVCRAHSWVLPYLHHWALVWISAAMSKTWVLHEPNEWSLCSQAQDLGSRIAFYGWLCCWKQGAGVVKCFMRVMSIAVWHRESKILWWMAYGIMYGVHCMLTISAASRPSKKRRERLGIRMHLWEKCWEKQPGHEICLNVYGPSRCRSLSYLYLHRPHWWYVWNEETGSNHRHVGTGPCILQRQFV